MRRPKDSPIQIKSTLAVEHFPGDVMKVVGEICHQLSDFDKLQNQEIIDVVRADIEALGLAPFNKRLKRPRAPRSFLKGYHSGNELTLSLVRREPNAATRFRVIHEMCGQLSAFDGLSKAQILALVKSYLDHHIIEVDV
jgi:hypothetical protein